MFKVIWDSEYNGVRLTMSSKGDALNVSPRPVFWEELDLLGLNKKGWIYPHVEEPILWACDRRYFYKGQFVLEVKGGNVFDAPTVIQQEGFETLTLQPVDMERLRSRNEDTMFIIEHEAMDFINQTYRRYKNIREVSQKNPDLDFQQLATSLGKKTKEEHVVVKEDCDSFDVMPLSKAEEQGKAPILNNDIELFVVSFSGGKDSQVTLDLVTRVIPSEDLKVVYSDTGYELPSSLDLYKHVESVYKEQYPTIEFYTAKNHEEVLTYWDMIGSPSNVHRWCCGVMKTAPLYRLLKEVALIGRQPHVLSFIGTRAEESLRRSTYLKVAKDAKHTNVINVSPILEWSTTEVWLYLFLNDLPINDAYRKGLGRVGCIVCPFGSDWNDYLCNHVFPETAAPFIGKIRELVRKRGVKDVDSYIKTGNWKIRAGGKGGETRSKVSIISTAQAPDFKALLTYPKENVFEWLKVMGPSSWEQKDNVHIGQIRYNRTIVDIRLTFDDKNQTILVDVPNIAINPQFISHLRRILNKVVYCVHCELCEVECPSGALNVVPIVKVDENKCIHCRRCLDFKDDGCISANSLKQAEGIKTISKKDKKTTINRYNNFGFREKWLQFYLEHVDTFFENDEHGINKENQMNPFLNWMRDSDILKPGSKDITEIGKLFAEKYSLKPETVWELIWINLTYNSEICNWYAGSINYSLPYKKTEIEAKMDMDPALDMYGSSVKKNALGALQNAFVSSPLGNKLQVGIISKDDSNKPVFSRMPHNNLSLVAVAYSLYRYAERQKRYLLTVSEFYDDKQKEGFYRQFGIDRDVLERQLISLQEESNHVLRAELNMGLDNIILREDLTSVDVLKLML
ncbi:MAG: phosphoadenosine phosphosulfate reductase family protein [Prevotella sp.]|nr:phosphoadenosine phosphosulfate reductase family protein [Prevotella sp.]